ncbi:hypothetical protein Syun_025714 [Stephania yunnanensis]|uniref:Uncharacterized protein n=1 Tax=Stephania yunnanensis TaxID=152371 RepID=A0AAP0HVH1_9MAGN
MDSHHQVNNQLITLEAFHGSSKVPNNETDASSSHSHIPQTPPDLLPVHDLHEIIHGFSFDKTNEANAGQGPTKEIPPLGEGMNMFDNVVCNMNKERQKDDKFQETGKSKRNCSEK